MFRPAALLITLSALLHTSSAGCRVNLNEHLTQRFAPLFLKPAAKGRYELLQPSGGYFAWDEAAQVVVGCSTGKNVLANVGTSLANVTCIKGQRFNVGSPGKSRHLRDLSCNSSLAGAIMSRNSSCADGNGVLYDLGFEMKGVPFVQFFKACYNLEKLSAIYSEHLLPGNLLRGKLTPNRCYWMLKFATFDQHSKKACITSKLSLASVYTRKHQLERFATLLGSSTLASQYINTSSYLAKGHLTPDGDAIVDSWTAATYFYINAAPEWQAVNVGNWLRVEKAVRKVATQLNDTVLVYTGVHDVLRLPGSTGAPVPMSLADDGLVEVPKWLWKVVVHQSGNSAIALITLNNPFAAGRETLCEDICSQYGWHQKEYQEVRKGFTYCCTVRDAQKAIKLMPKSIDGTHVLRYD